MIRNLAESVGQINEAMETLQTPYAVVGGIVTSFLTEGEVEVSKEQKVVEVDPDLFIDPFRANGTPRDLDTVALTDDSSSVAKMSEYLYKHVDIPGISVSGYIPDNERGPARFELVSRFFANDDEITLRLGEVSATISRNVYEDTWTLRRGEDDMQILHPMAHTLSYATRSVGGVRKRDKPKLKALREFMDEHFTDEDTVSYHSWKEFPTAFKTYVAPSEVFRHPTAVRLKIALAHRAIHLVESSDYLTKKAQDSGSRMARVAMRVLDRSGAGNMKTTM